MPGELGGTGDRVTPGWLFRAGLASCATTSIVLTAAAEGIELATLEVWVGSRSDARGLLGMTDDAGSPCSPAPATFRCTSGSTRRMLRPIACVRWSRGLCCSPVPAWCTPPLGCSSTWPAADATTMDALSETLRVVRLVGAIFLRPASRRPGATSRQRRQRCAPARARRRAGGDLPPDHRGRVLRRAAARRPCVCSLAMSCFSRRATHISWDPNRASHLGRARASRGAVAPSAPVLAYGGGGATTRLVCGYLACDARLAGCCSRDCRRWYGSTCAAQRGIGSRLRCATRWRKPVRRGPAVRACSPSWPRCSSSRCCAST